MKAPVLGYTPLGDTEEHSFIIGTSNLTLDGAPFPWPTVDEWTVKFTDDGVAYLDVHIAVSLPKDPAA